MSNKAKNKMKYPEVYGTWGADDVRTNAAIIERTLQAFGFKTKIMEVNALRFHVQYCIEIEIGTSVE